MPLFQEADALKSMITRTTSTCARKFYLYLHSDDAKRGILSGLPTRRTKDIRVLTNEIISLLMKAIQTWLKSEEIGTLMKDIDKSIRNYTHVLEKKAMKIMSELYEVNTLYYTELSSYSTNISSAFIALLPCTVSFGLADIISELLDHNEKIYDSILNNIQETHIENCLDKSITRKYFRIVDRICNVYTTKAKSIK